MEVTWQRVAVPDKVALSGPSYVHSCGPTHSPAWFLRQLCRDRAGHTSARAIARGSAIDFRSASGFVSRAVLSTRATARGPCAEARSVHEPACRSHPA